MNLRSEYEPMEDELIALLEKISQLTGTPTRELIRLAVLEFVHSFDLDFEGATNEVLVELGEGT